jgi:hypothetical protein
MESAREQVLSAVKAGDVKRLEELLAADPSLAATVDATGVSLRLVACYHQKPDTLPLLREVGPPLDIFETAALPGAAELGKELLMVDPGLARAWSSDGFTPLHLAAFFRRPSMAEALLGLGADPNAVARNPMAVQPLHSACAGRDVAIITMLLDHGADANGRQSGGWTPLHAAAMFGDLPLLEMLLSRGARPELTNDEGKSALDLAVAQGHAEVAEALRSRLKT